MSNDGGWEVIELYPFASAMEATIAVTFDEFFPCEAFDDRCEAVSVRSSFVFVFPFEMRIVCAIVSVSFSDVFAVGFLVCECCVFVG